MSKQLRVSIGQYSSRGRKDCNQDFHGLITPQEPLLSSKGIAIALADGISSSSVGHVASETAVTSFLEDYYCTTEAWTVKTSALRVIAATNSWLYSQTCHSHEGRYNKDKGYVCTFTALIFKSTTAHIFHVGDARVYRVVNGFLEQLTTDHRVVVSSEESFLSRALGVNARPDIDYIEVPVEVGEIYVLVTDGVHEYIDNQFVKSTLHNDTDYGDLDRLAKSIVENAYNKGSEDNITCQIARVVELPDKNVGEIYQQVSTLPLPPVLEDGRKLDSYTIVRKLHGGNRSHVYLAIDDNSKRQVVIKTPSVDLGEDQAYLERFLMEEWVARRISSPHVLKSVPSTGTRRFLYTTTEYVEGRSLAQWLVDNPRPDLETVRNIVAQIASGLQAFHRLEMLHQDLRPENILIDGNGTVKIIDFGSALVAGIAEIDTPIQQFHIQGTPLYTAPEYFLGEGGTQCSDLYSLGVITYHMLSGKFPYGADVARTRTRAAQHRLVYRSVLNADREIPPWIDFTLKKALHPDPLKRYALISEFLFDLRNPNPAFLKRSRPPLVERNPVAFWQGVSLLLFILLLWACTP